MPSETANTADLFEIIRTTRSMRRLKPDPVPNELIRKILEAGVSGAVLPSSPQRCPKNTVDGLCGTSRDEAP
jgi:hypothetical protein